MDSQLRGGLRREWAALAGTSAAAGALGEDLLARWSEPHRRYHTARHLHTVLRHLDALGSTDPAVRLAAWFHDAVYLPGRTGDEAASADLAAGALGRLGVEQGERDEVVRLVLLTADHRPSAGDRPGTLLCDADLAILGSRPEVYAVYLRAVREEYGEVAEDLWRAGRAALVDGFLGRQAIFRSAEGWDRWEAPARANLACELAALT